MLNFLIHRADILIEGYRTESFVNELMTAGIAFRNIIYISETELKATVSFTDYKRIEQLSRHKYNIYITDERGVSAVISRLGRRRGIAVGMIIAAGIVFYRQAFISEIRIDGYASVPESRIREALIESGLYTGRSRYGIDMEGIKSDIYLRFDNISYIGIDLKGALAEVRISESGGEGVTSENDDYLNDNPSNIVARKEAVIEKVIPLQGEDCVKPGDFVTKGAILITGSVPINNKTYDTSRDGAVRALRARGEVWGRVKYKWTAVFEAESYSEAALNREIRNKTQEDAQILNKELKFDENDNIISVTITIETLEEIGTEEFMNGDSENYNR